MTKRLAWIGVLSLVCAGVGADLGAQNRTSNRPASNAGAAHGQQQSSSTAHSSAAPPKAATTNKGQQPAVSPQGQSSGPARLPSAGTVQAHPSGAVPAQSSNRPQPQPASSNQLVEPNIHAVPQPAAPPAYGVVTPPSTGTSPPGTSPTNLTYQTPGRVPPPGDQTKQPPQSDTTNQKPSKDQPEQPTQSTNIQNQKPPRQKPKPPPVEPSWPINGRTYPPAWPQPALSPLFPLQQGVPLQRGIPTRGGQQPSPGASYAPDSSGQPPPDISDSGPSRPQGKTSTESGQTASPPPQHTPQDMPKPNQSGPESWGGGNVVQVQDQHPPPPPPPPVPPPPPAVLKLTPSSYRPAVGTTVVVTAELNPSQAGTNYELNWGDGSPVETVSRPATHRYAKAKMYKVSARTVVDNRQLNREILLPVVIWPWVTVSLASVAGVGLLSLHMLVNLTTGCRWDVPKVTVIGPQPYVSLSFVPGLGPAEESITLLKTKRRSG